MRRRHPQNANLDRTLMRHRTRLVVHPAVARRHRYGAEYAHRPWPASRFAWSLRPRLATVDVAMPCFSGWCWSPPAISRGPRWLPRLLSIAVFDFFFVPPYYTFDVHDSAYVLTFVVMLVVAFAMSRLTGGSGRTPAASRGRGQRTAVRRTRPRAGPCGAGMRCLASPPSVGRASQGSAAILRRIRNSTRRELPGWPARRLETLVRVAACLGARAWRGGGRGSRAWAGAGGDSGRPSPDGDRSPWRRSGRPGDADRELAEADRRRW